MLYFYSNVIPIFFFMICTIKISVYEWLGKIFKTHLSSCVYFLCLQKNFELKKDTKCLQVQREEFYNSNQALKNEIRKLRNQMDDSGEKQAVV